jgi:hypothetical protein
MEKIGIRIFSVILAIVFAYLFYIVGGYCWGLLTTPFAAQTLLGVILVFFSGCGALFLLVSCVVCIVYAIQS